MVHQLKPQACCTISISCIMLKYFNCIISWNADLTSLLASYVYLFSFRYMLEISHNIIIMSMIDFTIIRIVLYLVTEIQS